MSIIVAVTKNGRAVVATDTLTCFGESQRIPAPNASSSKARRIGESIVGASGWGIYDWILANFLQGRPTPGFEDENAIFSFFTALWRAMRDKYSFVNDQASAKDSPFADLDSTFLIVNRAGIFKVSTDMDVSRFRQYCAIGSGAEYALGALHHLYDAEDDPAVIARKAVETACQFDLFCGGEIETHEV